MLDDALGDLVDGALPLFQALDQPEGGSEFLAHVLPRLPRDVGVVPVDHAAVEGADAQTREALFVEHDGVPLVDLQDVDVRDHVVVAARVVLLAGFRIEVSDGVDVVHDLLEAARQRLREILEPAPLQESHVLLHHGLRRRALHVVER